MKKTTKKTVSNSTDKFFLNRRFVYIALAVVLIVLVATNLDKFTGGVVSPVEQRITKIYVSSDPNMLSKDNIIINAGQNIYITVETGSEGSKGEASIYDSTDFSELRTATVDLRYINPETGKVIGNCANVCSAKKVVSGHYKTGSDWRPGKYCARILDRLENKEIEACFTIR